ncbi:hypothetical protein SAMN05216264_1064 [Pseudomonas marincola]|nr:hypothetical protein [Pseudomonas orientalis]SFT90857.1 hypothetical protein SAMN05216264_1064 [Pseudomonas marincola]
MPARDTLHNPESRFQYDKKCQHVRIREIDRGVTDDVVLTRNPRQGEVDQWLSHPGDEANAGLGKLGL